ncbi:MAG: zf-TFIIB domain-containing protein [Planctomycetota bacterium]
MRSPIDQKTGLETHELTGGLRVMRCPVSGGAWLRPSAYWAWRERHDTDSLGESLGQDITPTSDSPAGKRCPEDGAFLIRHRVGHGLDFHLDRCGHCGGIWFDREEWEAVAQAGLAKQLHLVFTSAWQAEVRRQRAEQNREARLRERLGDGDYEKLRDVRAWIEAHPRAPELRAFLRGDED